MKQTFSVSGMKCMHCKARVEDALKGVKGVTSAQADLEGKSVTVEYDEHAVTKDDLRNAVASTGKYQLTD